jgi:hypothetical protein
VSRVLTISTLTCARAPLARRSRFRASSKSSKRACTRVCSLESWVCRLDTHHDKSTDRIEIAKSATAVTGYSSGTALILYHDGRRAGEMSGTGLVRTDWR